MVLLLLDVGLDSFYGEVNKTCKPSERVTAYSLAPAEEAVCWPKIPECSA